ncbi:MAG: tetratricopeptide repeat protein [Pirellulales bacterium]
MPVESPWIIETTDATFDRDVVERSHELPVVVDFWAAWCPPCRALAPILEKLAVEAKGGFLLAKADVERAGAAAAQFGVESIPAVFGLRGGRVVDQFLGALPEERLRAWLAGLEPSRVETLLGEAARLENSDPAAAEARLREAIDLDPREATARIALARLLAAGDRLAESEQLLDELAARGFLEPEAERLKAELSLRRAAGEVDSVEQCRTALDRSPGELALRWDLARALAGAGRYAEAMDHCLELVANDRRGLGEKARELMVHVFQVLPADDELSSSYRRKLSSLLY